MLHEKYLVPAEKYRPLSKKVRHRQHPQTEWIKVRTKQREAELRRNAQTKEIADCMKQILSSATNPQTLTTDIEVPTLKTICRRGSQADVTSASVFSP